MCRQLVRARFPVMSSSPPYNHVMCRYDFPSCLPLDHQWIAFATYQVTKAVAKVVRPLNAGLRAGMSFCRAALCWMHADNDRKQKHEISTWRHFCCNVPAAATPCHFAPLRYVSLHLCPYLNTYTRSGRGKMAPRVSLRLRTAEIRRIFCTYDHS